MDPATRIGNTPANSSSLPGLMRTPGSREHPAPDPVDISSAGTGNSMDNREKEFPRGSMGGVLNARQWNTLIEDGMEALEDKPAPETAPPPVDAAREPDVAKKSVIGELLGEGLTAAESGLMEDALLTFSLDNLLLLSSHGVKFQVKKLHDMPEDFSGFRVKEHFMNGHRQLIDDHMNNCIRTFDDLRGMDPRSMTLHEKEQFLKAQIARRDISLVNDDRDFGLLCTVDSSAPEEIENISRTPAISVHVPGSETRGVFLLRHRLARGIIIHEAAHMLDSIKGPDSSGEPGVNEPGGHRHWASELDAALGAHYAWFLGECASHPEKRWSHYATERNIRITEYLAEAVRMYAEKPDLLMRGDPDMYHFARTFVEKGAYPSTAFLRHA